MRNFIPTYNNSFKLPHNIYMQMLYVLRDYSRITRGAQTNHVLAVISEAINHTFMLMKDEYTSRNVTYGELDPFKAFFDYAYFSYMFAKKYSDYGASKSSWNLYRSKLAYHLAEKLNIL